MKLQPDKYDVPTINALGPGWVAVNGEKINTSVVISSRGQRLTWSCERYEDLTPDHFAQLADLSPELVIFGSGTRLRFPSAHWLAPLIERRIGLESMDTAAACRTYNILAGEGRHVIAALLIEGAG